MTVIETSDGRPEGRRDRKRRETRARIADVAMRLFRERGFGAVTIEEIAEGADISKPTFFNYFPAKEDVVLAWQDQFADALAEAVLARPSGEEMVAAVEAAMLTALDATATPEAFALDALIQATPALALRNQVKYLHLEARLAEALAMRSPEADPLEVRLLAMLSIGALRIGTETWRADGTLDPPELLSFSKRFLVTFWSEVGRFSHRREGEKAKRTK